MVCPGVHPPGPLGQTNLYDDYWARQRSFDWICNVTKENLQSKA